MTDAEFTKEALHCARTLVGVEALAARLEEPVHRIELWISGYGVIPQRKLMLLIDLLLDVSPSPPLASLTGT
jgi:hypothetical protein